MKLISLLPPQWDKDSTYCQTVEPTLIVGFVGGSRSGSFGGGSFTGGFSGSSGGSLTGGLFGC
jgi:hypothetical protein